MEGPGFESPRRLWLFSFVAWGCGVLLGPSFLFPAGSSMRCRRCEGYRRRVAELGGQVDTAEAALVEQLAGEGVA